MQEPAASELFSLLYVSRSADLDAGDVDGICRQSQLNNQRDGITGLLVFDGAAFCQLVEGPHAALGGLRQRLERDHRHCEMRVLHLGPSPTRRFPSWRLGYAFVAGPEAIAAVERASSETAMHAFDATMGPLAAREAAGASR